MNLELTNHIFQGLAVTGLFPIIMIILGLMTFKSLQKYDHILLPIVFSVACISVLSLIISFWIKLLT